MSAITTIVRLQNDADAIISQTSAISNIIKSIQNARKLSGFTPIATADDLTKNLDCWVRKRYVPCVSSIHQYFRASPEGIPAFGETVKFDFNSSNALFTGDIFIKIEIGAIGDPTMDAQVRSYLAGTNPTFDPSTAWKYAYCDYPGISLIEQVQFLISGNPIEQYSREEMLDYVFHELTAEKRLNFLRMLGQQDPRIMSYYNPDNETNVQIPFFDGPQTLKYYQPALTVYVPIMFAWCLDSKQPLNNQFLPENNRSIQISFGALNRIIRAENLLTGATKVINSKDLSMFATSYSRAVFVDERLTPIFMEQKKVIVKSSLTRSFLLDNTITQINLQQFSYPIEMMYLRFVPTENVDFAGNQKFAFSNWYKPSQIITETTLIPRFSTILPGPPVLVGTPAVAYVETEIIKSMSLTMTDTDIYPGAPTGIFYSDYLPEVNGLLLKTSRIGAYVIPFSQYYDGILTDRTAGYLDFSQVDNMVLSWNAPGITTTNKVNLTIGVRYMNYYEPTVAGVTFRYAGIR